MRTATTDDYVPDTPIEGLVTAGELRQQRRFVNAMYRPRRTGVNLAAFARQRRGAMVLARRAASRAAAYTIRRPMPAQRGFVRNTGFYGRFSGQQGELKFFDTAIGFNFDTTAEIPATGQLSLIPQGVTPSTRIGRKCTIKSISIHGVVYSTPAAAATFNDVAFLYLIQDTQCNGAAATVADANVGIFTGANLATANHTLANGGRFRVLKKWILPFGATAGVTTAYNGQMKHIQYFKRCQIPLEFDSALDTGAITTIRSNNLFLVAGTAGNTDDTITMAGTCRLRFADNHL